MTRKKALDRTHKEALEIIRGRGLRLTPQPCIDVRFSDGSSGSYHALMHPRTGKYLRQDNTFTEPVGLIDHLVNLLGEPEYFEHAQEAAEWLEQNPHCTTRRKPKPKPKTAAAKDLSSRGADMANKRTISGYEITLGSVHRCIEILTGRYETHIGAAEAGFQHSIETTNPDDSYSIYLSARHSKDGAEGVSKSLTGHELECEAIERNIRMRQPKADHKPLWFPDHRITNLNDRLAILSSRKLEAEQHLTQITGVKFVEIGESITFPDFGPAD